mgnify:CR=1 FL=1
MISFQERSGTGEIEWNKTTQGWVLSAFYLGYLITQTFGGVLAGRYGGKLVFLCGQAVFTVSTLLTPLAARFVALLARGYIANEKVIGNTYRNSG